MCIRDSFAGISVLAGGWIFARQQATKTLKVSAETAPETIQQYGKELHELGDDPEGKITLHKKTQQQLGFLVRQKEYKMFAAAMKALIRETVSIDMVRARGACSVVLHARVSDFALVFDFRNRPTTSSS